MQIELSDDEALVLFEWLYELSESPAEAQIPAAERFALLRLEGQLEARLAAIVRPHYRERVEEARARLRILAGADDE